VIIAYIRAAVKALTGQDTAQDCVQLIRAQSSKTPGVSEEPVVESPQDRPGLPFSRGVQPLNTCGLPRAQRSTVEHFVA